MKATLAEASVVGSMRRESPNGALVRQRGRRVYSALMVVAAFGLYWISALVLAARNGASFFGADTFLYMQLANGDVIERIGSYYTFDRITRFHPLTTAMAVAWMKVLSPLTLWITPQQLLKAMFAAVGAVGVWAAMSAFAAVVPRRHVALWGSIYATSLGVWYFSSIEESKIVTTTLTALYVATYLHLRKNWTMRGGVLLTTILLAACLNEIVAAFLVIIPAVDTLVQRGWDLRRSRWIGLHALVAPMALAFLEGVVNGRWASAGGRPPPEDGIAGLAAEGASHLSMLLFYVTQNDFSVTKLYAFLANWFVFQHGRSHFLRA